MIDWLTEIPAGKAIEFGDLRRRTPISTRFAYDRGTPIDRLYIEEFLENHRGDVRGRVLEVGDNSYTMRFGGNRVVHSDILHVRGGAPGATIIADLADAAHVPSDSFDCIILSQVLELVYEVRAAVATLYRILKPGGVLLATVPGISNIDHGEWHKDWMWSFTVNSLRRLLAEKFPSGNVRAGSRGNVFTATAFLHGLSLEDIAQFDHRHDDPHYQVTVLARAVKEAP